MREPERPGYPLGVDWDDLRYFLSLARLGSVRAAGDALGVSHSTVARRVEALEEQVGARLFDRHRDGYRLTEVGARMVPAAERIEEGVCALTREVAGRDQQLSGRIHVTCGDEYVAAQILQDLGPWCQAHPGLELAVSRDERAFNLAKGEADIAVRALGRGASPPEYLVARRLAPIFLASYVARTSAERLDPSREGARWLAFEDRQMQEVLVRTSSYPHLPMWGTFSTLDLMVRAALEGLGLAFLPVYAGDVEPGLARLPHPDLRHMGDLWLLYHPDLRENARVQAAREVIREGFARRSALFEGWSEIAPQRPADAPGSALSADVSKEGI